jgi:stage III sporulation protein AF
MREVVYAWAQQLVFLILFVTVVEMILPAGELRRYTKMVVGLVVILAVLDPLLQVVQGPRWTDLLIRVPADEVMAPSRAVEAGRRMLADATMATKAGAQMAPRLLDGIHDLLTYLSSQIAKAINAQSVQIRWRVYAIKNANHLGHHLFSREGFRRRPRHIK